MLYREVQLTDAEAKEFPHFAFYCLAANDSAEIAKALLNAIEALKFYRGQEDNELDWDFVNHPGVMQDKGKLARQTLAEIEEMGK